ncbi:MAG: ABC transporter permease [Thermodesulfovibrionales bacterium]|nr:ABC transporter permease [Thermodesulfovibrionales bacterium]
MKIYSWIFLNFKIAIGSLCGFRVRTLLAISGVFLGTFSLIIVANISKSLVKKTELEAEKLGKDIVVVRSGIVRRFGARMRILSESTTLKIEDADAIMKGATSVIEVSPSSSKAFPVRYGGTSLSNIPVIGVMPNYSAIRNFSVEDGVFFTEDDVRELNRVAVLGKAVARKLFGDEDPIGRNILIFRVAFQVVGVMEEKGVDVSGVDQDNQVFVPLSTFLRRLVNKDYINTIYVKIRPGGYNDIAKSEIRDILRKQHRLKEEKEDDFTLIDMKDVMTLQTQAITLIKTLGRISAVISFLIGGIGILSIMILIVNERKVEIGIRRAVGATKRDIIIQFLMESSFISLTGGMTGLAVSLPTSAIIFNLTGLPFSISVIGIIFSTIASISIGILAGIYPSKRATTFEPLQVIRH